MVMQGIRIWPEDGSQIDVWLQAKKDAGWIFSGIGFFCNSLGFYGYLNIKNPKTSNEIHIVCSGKDEPVFKIDQSISDDPCDIFREFDDAMTDSYQPTPYDP